MGVFGRLKSRQTLGAAALLWTALVLIAGVSGSFAQEAKIGSTSIRLTPPKGQCGLSNEKGDEALLVSKLRELLGGKNQLLAVYADCDELAQLRSGKLEEFNEFAHYLAPKGSLNAVARPNDLAQICALMRAKSDQDVVAIFQNRAADIERLLPGVTINQPKFLGVLAEESAACYSGQLSKLTTVSGTEKMQAAIVAIVLLKGKFVTYQLYALYRSINTIPDLLRRHKANVAALIAANGE